MSDLPFRESPAPWQQWGTDIDDSAIQQIRNACELPVAVRGALMPDAHVGYGLPIGGVLATDNAVIPYAVGVDIACRVKITVFDLPATALEAEPDRFKTAIARETQFGVGATFKRRRDHAVMDADWSVSPVTARNKDRAWAQLGTSGSGNHFVEFGEFTNECDLAGMPPGTRLALLSHSGSRGTGASVADHYSKLAAAARPELPKHLQHLAWLGLDTDAGREYWAAMSLMGLYAQSNHDCIHDHITAALGATVLFRHENHHNFAWKETHDGRELVVHRKGATPAGRGVLGIIPGSMATPTYLVEGLGNAASLDSSSHGAGRVMSRTKAFKTLDDQAERGVVRARGVTVMSASLDEMPAVYKDIDAVMRAQADLVAPLARFFPRLVKMAPRGERAED